LNDEIIKSGISDFKKFEEMNNLESYITKLRDKLGEAANDVIEVIDKECVDNKDVIIKYIKGN